MRKRKLLARLSQGHLQNVPFEDFLSLVRAFGFYLVRVSSSHHLLAHPAIREQVNLQEVRGEAKPYQIRQFLRLVERYNLRLEDEP